MCVSTTVNSETRVSAVAQKVKWHPAQAQALIRWAWPVSVYVSPSTSTSFNINKPGLTSELVETTPSLNMMNLTMILPCDEYFVNAWCGSDILVVTLGVILVLLVLLCITVCTGCCATRRKLNGQIQRLTTAGEWGTISSKSANHKICVSLRYMKQQVDC